MKSAAVAIFPFWMLFNCVHSNMLHVGGNNIFDEEHQSAESQCPNGAKLGKECKKSSDCGERGFCRLTMAPGKGKKATTHHCCEHTVDAINLICHKSKKGKAVRPSKIACSKKSKKDVCAKSKIKGYCKFFKVAGQSHKVDHVGLCCPSKQQ